MDIEKYRTLFVNESREYLQGMSERILKLGDPSSQTDIEWLFRAAHSIKGMSASLGYDPLTGLTHRMESVLDNLQKAHGVLDQNLQTVLLHGLDLIESMLNEIDKGEPIRTATDTFDLALKKLRTAAGERAPARASRFLYKLECTLAGDPKTISAEKLISRMEEFGRVSGLQSPRDQPGAGLESSLTCYLVTSYAAMQLEEALRSFPEVRHVYVIPVDPQTKSSPEAEAAAVFENTEEVFRLNTVRVDVEKIDRLIEDTGELLIHHAGLQETHPENIQFSRLRSLAKQLYDRARDLRMLPFETISSRFPRVVHDLARKLGKKVQLKIEGAGTWLDKALLMEIADALIHLLRNAVDHGIERPEVRVSAGKDERGTIVVSVRKKGDCIQIAVEDDGRGLDCQIIKKTAVDNGLIPARAADVLNTQEILFLITRPGFSTASNLSEISGRGVGLDAVRARIDSIGGQLLIFSIPGKYTRFELILPFTLMLIPALLIRILETRLAVPLSKIRSVVLLKKTDFHYTHGRPVVYYEDRAISVEHLGSIFQRSFVDFQEEFPAFITEHNNREIAWVVDELLDEKEILLKLLGPPLNRISFYAGATILMNGEIVPVLDMERIYRERYE